MAFSTSVSTSGPNPPAPALLTRISILPSEAGWLRTSLIVFSQDSEDVTSSVKNEVLGSVSRAVCHSFVSGRLQMDERDKVDMELICRAVANTVHPFCYQHVSDRGMERR
jgi:hypothetical protein